MESSQPLRHIILQRRGYYAAKSHETWEDVDNALKEILENTNAIDVIETELSVKVSDAQDKAAKLAAPHKEKIETLESRILSFTEAHMDELEKKSKKLTFGQVGFRQSTKTVLTENTEDVITALKKYKMSDCVEIKETVNKNMMKKYSDAELERVGVKRVTEENFFYKV